MATPQILVAEDEGIVAEEIRGRLQGLGYTVPAVAHSGERAIEKAKAELAGSILLDIKMPGMDGIAPGQSVIRTSA